MSTALAPTASATEEYHPDLPGRKFTLLGMLAAVVGGAASRQTMPQPLGQSPERQA